MMRLEKVAITLGTLFFWVLLTAGASAMEEPARPNVDFTFDAQREAKISQLRGLQLTQVVNELQNPAFLVNEDFMHTAIFKAFAHREKAAIAHALDLLKEPRLKIVDGQIARNQSHDFYVAKKILRVFPDKAAGSLLSQYPTADPVMKANIIGVLGKMQGGPAIKNLLIEALDDKTACEEKHLEMLGKPLRICDEAYNQLVLRYKVRNVLRCIGNGHRIEDRDYHIDILKDLL